MEYSPKVREIIFRYPAKSPKCGRNFAKIVNLNTTNKQCRRKRCNRVDNLE
jgi:hypothetical protein